MKEGGPHLTKGKLPEYVKYLKKTGREWAIEELKIRHPNDFDVGGK
jgi:hypothetical protein